MLRSFLLKTSILINLFYFKISVEHKNMNLGRQWHKNFAVGVFHPFLLKTSILMNFFCFKFPAGYKNANTDRQ